MSSSSATLPSSERTLAIKALTTLLKEVNKGITPLQVFSLTQQPIEKIKEMTSIIQSMLLFHNDRAEIKALLSQIFLFFIQENKKDKENKENNLPVFISAFAKIAVAPLLSHPSEIKEVDIKNSGLCIEYIKELIKSEFRLEVANEINGQLARLAISRHRLIGRPLLDNILGYSEKFKKENMEGLFCAFDCIQQTFVRSLREKGNYVLRLFNENKLHRSHPELVHLGDYLPSLIADYIRPRS